MEAFAKPIKALSERVAWFVRKKGIRLLHVTADNPSREAAVELVMGYEFHAENRSPFVRADSPFSKAEPAWAERSSALRQQHEVRRKKMEKAGVVLPALRATPASGKPLVDFAMQVQQLALARVPPLEGLVVVLAPVAVSDVGDWDNAVGELVATPSLSEVSWVVIDLVTLAIPKTLRALGDKALATTCVVDEKEARDELARQIDLSAAAAAGAPAAAQTGGAWPRGVVPPSRSRAPKLDDAGKAAFAAAAGIPMGLFDPGIREIRTGVMRAAQRLRVGDTQGAIRNQALAAERAANAGMTKEATVLELVLCAYLMNAGQNALAAERYEACARRARESRWHDLEAQALMALGALHLVARDRDRAAAAYARAGAAGRDGKETRLAIEGFRMAGQLRVEAGDREQAIQLFGEAIALSNPLPLPDAGRTSAPLAARQLAELCRKQGLKPQAASLEEQAKRMELAARG